MPPKIHVVSFQVPYPANYGGVIDVWYKLTALLHEGYDVTLHTFAYNNRQVTDIPNLQGLTVKQYHRFLGIRQQFSLLPYVVKTRQNKQLIENLLKDDSPILFEGIHTCAPLLDPRLSSRKTIIRMHNVEHEYYDALGNGTKNIFKKAYYHIEAYKLKVFEDILHKASHIAAITDADLAYFNKYYKSTDSFLLPCFFDNSPLYSEPVSTKPYVLYHGNLAVSENDSAACWIVDNIVSGMPDIDFVIAGANPSNELAKKVTRLNNVQLKPSPSDIEMEHLIKYASIHLLITFQATGIKLKLLNALKAPGIIVANSTMISGTGLHDSVLIADRAEDMEKIIRKNISGKMTLPKCIPSQYNNIQNIKRLISHL